MPRTRSNPSATTYALGALALAAVGGIVYKVTYARTLAEARAAYEAQEAERSAGRAERRAARVAEREASQPAGSGGRHKDAAPGGGIAFSRSPRREAGA